MHCGLGLDKNGRGESCLGSVSPTSLVPILLRCEPAASCSCCHTCEPLPLPCLLAMPTAMPESHSQHHAFLTVTNILANHDPKKKKPLSPKLFLAWCLVIALGKAIESNMKERSQGGSELLISLQLGNSTCIQVR